MKKMKKLGKIHHAILKNKILNHLIAFMELMILLWILNTQNMIYYTSKLENASIRKD